ncbi:MAG: CHASE3 domain-containing protein [Burkholderiales bacterium]|nr:CHASE3 domain-containing protein [Burkholderiales bacterium]MDE2626031.1 CHASE3 domain-containing protein [Burkholderiales bacterium]
MRQPLKLLPLLRGSRFAFPLAALVALAFFMISESSYQQATATFAELGTEGTARTTIQVLWRSLTDAETGQRGYLLTGRKEYLKPYTEAQTQVAQSLDWLNRYYGTDPATAGLMKRVTLASRDKLSELAETMKLYDEGKEESWRALVLSDIGKEQMDTVRSQSEQLLAIESTRLAAARKSLAQTLLLNRIGVTAMTALSLLALFMYLRQTTVVVRQREEQRRIVQAERDLLEREVVRRTEQLTELTRHLQTVREDERNHLARELHDELGALLTAAKLDVARLKSRLGALAPEVAERLQHLNDGLNSGIALKRRIIEDLRPSSLSNLGLVAALEILVREWAQNTEIAVRSALEPVRLRPSGELTVYRLVQEALTNISKYARASQVAVELSSEDGQVRVLVRDNGVGFDVNVPRTSAHGLLGMRYRLETEGGRLILSSAPGQGTAIEAQLPESSEGQPAAPGHAALATA